MQRLAALPRPLLFFVVGWSLFFTMLWSQLFFFDEMGNFVTRHSYAWADWAAHFTMGSSFGYRALWLEHSPFISTQKFSYPFAINLISGLLIRAHLPFFWAFIVPSWFCTLATVGLLYTWYRRWLNSSAQAALAGTLFLLNGGVGFGVYVTRILQSSQPWQMVLTPNFDVTNLESEGLRWISVINSMIVPQRAFTLGLPVGLLLLVTFYHLLNRLQTQVSPHRHTSSHWSLLHLSLVSGCLLGSLPLIHTHTFLALTIIISCWSAAALWCVPTRLRRRLVAYLSITAITAGVIATPIIVTFYVGHVSQTFFKWYPGWLAKEFNVNPFIFWLRNWGLTPVLGGVGMVLVGRDHRLTPFQKKVWIPFVLLFVMSNLFLFQPWSWDNTKLLMWSSVGISGYAVWTVNWLWQQVPQRKNHLGGLLIVGIGLLFASLIVSGGIDALQAINPRREAYVMYTAEELELAAWVKAKTPVHAVWLTDTRHNHWLFNLTGRQAVVTYPGWLWSQGYDSAQVERDVARMWRDPSLTTLFDQYQVEYVAVDLQKMAEGAQADLGTNPHFVLVKSSPHYELYQRQLSPVSNLSRSD